MKKSETIMRAVTLAVMAGLMTLVTYNVVAYGTSHDELYIGH